MKNKFLSVQCFRSTSKKIKKLTATALFSLSILGSTMPVMAQDAAETPLGTISVLGKVDGITLEGKVESPSEMVTPLQISCVFEDPTGTDIYSADALPAKINGLVYLDKALKGLITDLRKSGRFKGTALETLLIKPAAGTIPAKQFMLIGLGDRQTFTMDRITEVAKVAMREALRLGVQSFAFSGDLKDGGYSTPTDLRHVLQGFFDAYRTQKYLADQKMASKSTLEKITLLDGPKFAAPSQKIAKEAIRELNNK